MGLHPLQSQHSMMIHASLGTEGRNTRTASCERFICTDFQSCRNALESSVLAWLKKESGACRLGSIELDADMETRSPNSHESSLVNEDTGIEGPGTRGSQRNFPCQVQWHSGMSSPAIVGTVFQTLPSQDLTATAHLFNPSVSPRKAPTNCCTSFSASPLPEELWLGIPSTKDASLGPSTNIVPVIKSCVQAKTLPNGTGFIWTVDAKKMWSKDRVIVSPPFEILLGWPVPFRMMLWPRAMSKRRDGQCFKTARGVGSVQLKCEAILAEEDAGAVVTFTLAVGQGSVRGPVTHNFVQEGVCGLPKSQQEWNFIEAVDDASQTLSVYLEVLR